MTSHEREAEFPVHIEVGKSMDKALPKLMGEHNKKVKNKKFYPTLYISDIKGL